MWPHFKSPFSACVGGIGFVVFASSVSQGGTPGTDLSKDFNKSAFSTTSILSDLTNSNKQLQSAEVTPFSNGSVVVSSHPGAFQYDSETHQTTSAHKLSEEIRAAQELENQRNAEITEHPFWYARFWTHSPLVIPAFLLGGDIMRLRLLRQRSRNWAPPVMGTKRKCGSSNAASVSEV